MSATSKSQTRRTGNTEFMATAWPMAPAMEMSSELLWFASHRLQAHADLWASLARCGSQSDVAEVEAEFVDVAMADYTKEAATLLRTAQDSTPRPAT